MEIGFYLTATAHVQGLSMINTQHFFLAVYQKGTESKGIK